MRDWWTEPLERIAEIRSSNVDKKTNPGEEPVRLCNYMDVYSREYITEDIEFMDATATPAEIQRFGVERGDVMITKDSETPDDIGIPAVVVDDIAKLVCGYHVALIKPNRTEVDPLYLAKQLALSDTARYYGRLANGSTRYGLSYQSIARTPIRLAPLPQQQRIAEILSTVDEAIEQTEALIAKTQQIKAGLMHDLFTRGMTANGQLRPPREEAPQLYKETPLGWIPKEWDYDHLSELTMRIVDGVHHTPRYVEHGIPFVTVKNLTASRTIDFADLNYISLRDHQEFIRRADPKVGDVLVTKDGTLGVSRLVEEWHPEFSIFVSVAMLRPIAARLRPRMLHMFFDCGAYERQLGRLSAGTGLKHIHLEHFRRFVIPLPDSDEQDRIAGVADSVEGKLANEEAHLAKLERLKQGLMQDLLSGAVSVAAEHEPEPKEVAANV